jgi:hypothetical protein
MIPWLVAAISLGFAAAFIAGTKGRPFLPRLAYGTLLGVVAIPHALFMREEVEPDDDPEMRPMRGDSRKFTGSWAENWMEGDAAAGPRRRAATAARGSRRPDEVPAAWSDDAFARIVGDESPLAEFSAMGGGGSPGERVRRDTPPAADRRSPENEEGLGVTPPAGRGDTARAASFRHDEVRDTLRHPSAGRVNGNGMGRRDFLNVARDGYDDDRVAEDDRIRDEDDSVAFARDRHDAGHDEPRFEPRLEFEGNGWRAGGQRAGDRYEDERYEDAWIARRFAPDPMDSGGTDRRESKRGSTLSYAFAALCMVLAAVLVWPRPSDAPAPDRITSSSTAPVSKEAGSGATSGPGTATPGPTPFAPPSLHKDDTFMRSDNTVARSFAPPPLPPHVGTDRTALGGRDDGGLQPDKAGQGAGTAVGVPPRPPKDRPSAEPEIKAAPSSDVARVDPAAPHSVRPTPAPKTRGVKAAPEKPAPRVAPKAAPKTKSTGANRAPKEESETITAVGQMVLLVQAELKKRGYEPGDVNGRAGEQTRHAIREFKRKEGLGVNSTIDDELFERLGIVGRRLHPFASSRR